MTCEDSKEALWYTFKDFTEHENPGWPWSFTMWNFLLQFMKLRDRKPKNRGKEDGVKHQEKLGETKSKGSQENKSRIFWEETLLIYICVFINSQINNYEANIEWEFTICCLLIISCYIRNYFLEWKKVYL